MTETMYFEAVVDTLESFLLTKREAEDVLKKYMEAVSPDKVDMITTQNLLKHFEANYEEKSGKPYFGDMLFKYTTCEIQDKGLVYADFAAIAIKECANIIKRRG